MKTVIEFLKGDITEIKVDAIVNAANKTLLGGGGVDAAIHRLAGPELLAECKTLGGCETGQAKITKGYHLLAKFVIHTVGPIYGRECGRESKLLADCYHKSLFLAKKQNIRTIAFPAIATGAYGYPEEEAAQIAIEAVKSFIKDNPATFKKIIFVLFTDEDYNIYQQLLNKQNEK